MTLTPPVVNAAGLRVVLVTEGSKAAAVAGWIERRDPSLPVTRVRRTGTVAVLDAAAASALATT
jgi:6-phosphogluconolactonase/glucosamine-6-phosphate isomerase/deaminase